ncbi:MAG: hypothetical protein RIR26_1673 [Pseudomonadota bacterium]
MLTNPLRKYFLLLCLSAFSCAAHSPAQAWELGAGGGFVSHGDTRTIPAVQSWFQTGFGLLVGATNSGEKNSSFSQQTMIAHASYAKSFSKSKSVQASVGLGALLSRTRIVNFEFIGQPATRISRSGGVATGLRWTPSLSKSLRFRLSWDGLFVPPGWSVLFWTFGHSQSLTAGLGWDF